MTESIVLAVANQKGGVGKTTSAVNIAASVASLGHSVLLIDSDPQGNATSGLGVNRKEVRRSLYDVLLGECSAEEAVLETGFKNLSTAVARIRLSANCISSRAIPHWVLLSLPATQNSRESCLSVVRF